MFIRVFSSRKTRTGSVPVFLNVYDLTPVNGYAYWLGLGIYHSGVQVHGVEYAYGAHENPCSGIFEGEPKMCPGFRFRKSILVGRTDLGPREVRAFMDKLGEQYTGNTYSLISKNCNHFCDDVSVRLTGDSIPRWVNRLANLGFLCNCVLPFKLQGTAVAKDEKGLVVVVRKEGEVVEEKKKLRSKSERYPASSPPPSPTASHATNNGAAIRDAAAAAEDPDASSSSSPTSSSCIAAALSRKNRWRRSASTSSRASLVASDDP